MTFKRDFIFQSGNNWIYFGDAVSSLSWEQERKAPPTKGEETENHICQSFAYLGGISNRI